MTHNLSILSMLSTSTLCFVCFISKQTNNILCSRHKKQIGEPYECFFTQSRPRYLSENKYEILSHLFVSVPVKQQNIIVLFFFVYLTSLAAEDSNLTIEKDRNSINLGKMQQNKPACILMPVGTASEAVKNC